MKSEEKVAEFQLENIVERDGKYYFTATSLTEEFEAKRCREILARESMNKHLIWRHRHPIDKDHNHAHIFGTITNSKSNDKAIISEYMPYTHTDLHRIFIEEIKEKKAAGDPVGISMRYRKYFDDDGNITHLDVFEHSLTPFPKCEKCLVIDDYIGEKEMPEEETKILEETDEQKARLKRIEELEAALNSSTESLEKYKTKIETLEKTIEASKDKKDSETKTLEDRVKSLEEKLEKAKHDYDKKVEDIKKEPILTEMFELKDLDEDEKEFYKNLSLEKLIPKRDKWAAEAEATKPFVKPMEESANESAESGNGDSKNELTDEDIDKFVKDTRMRSIMKKMLKKGE